jgi:hypothetical protein
MVEGIIYEKEEDGTEVPKVKNLANFTTIA